MNYIQIIGATTPDNMISIKYDAAKDICYHIWEKPKRHQDFEDVFHHTLHKCLENLDRLKKYEQEYLKAYLFKAFRINMIRFYGYAYNRLTSGDEVSELIIPVSYNIDNHMDGFEMLDYVQCKHGQETRNLLWDNLNGITYKELDTKYNVNSFYILSKVKNELKQYYFDHRFENLDEISRRLNLNNYKTKYF